MSRGSAAPRRLHWKRTGAPARRLACDTYSAATTATGPGQTGSARATLSSDVPAAARARLPHHRGAPRADPRPVRAARPGRRLARRRRPVAGRHRPARRARRPGPPRHARVPARLPGAAARRAAPRGRRPVRPAGPRGGRRDRGGAARAPGRRARVDPRCVRARTSGARTARRPRRGRGAPPLRDRHGLLPATGARRRWLPRRRGGVRRRDPGRPRRGARAIDAAVDGARAPRDPRACGGSEARTSRPGSSASRARHRGDTSRCSGSSSSRSRSSSTGRRARSSPSCSRSRAAVALAAGVGRLLGFSFTVVSAIVPLTVMVTTLASLVYLHSRFVDQPEGVPVDAHQLAALADKFLPVTASSAAAVSGFAALAVSRIRPIREMGLWTATGLAIAWVVALHALPRPAARAPDTHAPDRRDPRRACTIGSRARSRRSRSAGAGRSSRAPSDSPRPASSRSRASRAASRRWASASTCSGTWTRRCPSTRTCGSSGTTSRASTSPASGCARRPGAVTDPEVLRALDRFTSARRGRPRASRR